MFEEHFWDSLCLECRLNISGFARVMEKPNPSSQVETDVRDTTVRSAALSPSIHSLRPGQTDK